MTSPCLSLPRTRRIAAALALLLGFAACLCAAAEPVKTFDVPADSAARTLRIFSEQAGVPVAFGSDTAAQVRTPAVKGELTTQEALARLLEGTGLVAATNDRTGAITISRVPNAPRAAAAPSPARPEAKTPSDDEVLTLSPFTVSTEKDTGYAASSSLAGSRVRTELRDLAAPISVLTKDFLEDIGATSMQDAIGFVAGGENNFQSSDPASGNADGDLRSPNANRLRGLGSSTVARNYFTTGMRLDTYNTSRIDVARGPNSLLFGLGSPAGVVNSTLDRAAYRNTAAVEARFDSEGSHRAGFHANREVIARKLALRVAGLHEQAETWKKPSLDHQNRGYLAIAAQPFAHTSLHANYERFWNRRELPKTTPPRDFVSPWIAAGRPMVSTWATSNQPNPPAGLIQLANTFRAVFVNGSLGSVPQFYNSAFEFRSRGESQGLTGANAFALTLPREIFPADVNITGPASFAELKGNALNASVEQRIGRDLSFELAYNRETNDGYLLDLGSVGVANIYADPNRVLSDGRPNPNAGRFFFEENPRMTRGVSTTEALRLTGSYELNLIQRSRWLGRHRLSGLAVRESSDSTNDTAREFISSNHAWLAAAAQTDLFNTSRRLVRRFYVDDPAVRTGGSLSATLAALRLDGAVAGPDGVGVVSDPLRVGHISNSRTKLETRSLAGVWQSYLFGDRVVTTLGWRHDTQDVFLVSGRTVGGTGPDRNLFLPGAAMATPSSPTINDTANTNSRGVAFHATSWLSLYYNQADNFSLSGGNLDLYSRPIPGAKGKGRDFAVGFRLWQDRLILRATRYETSQIGSLAPSYRAAVRFRFSNIEDAVASYAGAQRDPNLAPAEAWVTQDTKAKGEEFEAILNPTNQWRIAFNAARQEAKLTNIALQARDYLAARLPLWQPYFDRTLLGSATTIRTEYETNILPTMDLAVANDGSASPKLAEWRWNVVTNYSFGRDSLFKGFSVGGTMRWVDAPVIGYQDRTLNGRLVPDVSKPWFGAEFFSIDARIGYARKLSARYGLRVQLHIRNVLGADDPAPVRIRSTGAGAVYQTIDPRLYILSASVTF